MTIPEDVINQLTKGLREYNPTTYDTMDKIAKAMIPFGTAILFILFMIEFSNTYKKLDREEGGMTIELLGSIAVKYIVALVFIMNSGVIIDALVWFGNEAVKWIQSIIDTTGTNGSIPEMGKVAWWAKPIVALFEVFAYIALWLSELITKILICLRAIQFYIVKAVAPILIAFLMSEELRSIAIGFLKQVGALVLQGVLLILIIGLIPIITANDFASFNVDGVSGFIQAVMDYVGLIFKYIAIIILLIGSQGLSKRLVGAN
ncbi:type III secretion system protein PrgH [Enterococcus faecalis]|uniref:hypothetical protein n=1 Tax=Enterococcus faecalis TaxID=1351 RepID=UPI00045B9FAE|nr:hypothetical protein [Enterococcus faecalis]EHV0179361.1 type III secretion system protein PrgH [Enterococcus faecalis]KAJ85616.1 hypothetical protein P791_1215 [Enterococcus faecalis NY9]